MKLSPSIANVPRKKIPMDDDKLLLQMTLTFEKKFGPKVKAFVDSILSNPEIGNNAAVQYAALGGIAFAMSSIVTEKFDQIGSKLGIDPKKAMS